jgi:hypothetical protein
MREKPLNPNECAGFPDYRSPLKLRESSYEKVTDVAHTTGVTLVTAVIYATDVTFI